MQPFPSLLFQPAFKTFPFESVWMIMPQPTEQKQQIEVVSLVPLILGKLRPSGRRVEGLTNSI
jgi:hypothetical protein